MQKDKQRQYNMNTDIGNDYSIKCSLSTLGAKISIKHCWFTPTHSLEFQSALNVLFLKGFAFSEDKLLLSQTRRRSWE